jgi:outer membrane protein OmpA-like peptidoglycan-associated protein
MTGKYLMKVLGAALLVLLVAGVSGCTFRDGPLGDYECEKEKHADKEWAEKQDVEDLEKRVSTLEEKSEEIAKVAEKARMTAEKALKCCRKEYTVVTTEEIYFDFNKSDVRADATAALDRVAAKLKEDPDLICECKGHTDGIGNADYNVVLGQKRADAARSYLIDKHKIDLGRVAIRTFGEDAPIASNDTDAGRAKNRRVTIDVLGFDL